MKKSLLSIILAGLFSTSSLALAPATETSNINMEELMSEIQSASETGALNNQKEEKKSKIGRTLLKRAIQYKAIKTVVKNPRKTLIAGAIIGGVGYYGYGKMKDEIFKQKIAHHKIFKNEWQNLVDYYPDDWNELVERVFHDLENSKDEIYVKNLEIFIDFLILSETNSEKHQRILLSLTPSNLNRILITEIFEQIENEFKKNGKKCDKADLQKLVNDELDLNAFSHNDISYYPINGYLKFRNHSKTGDHIPSYKAIESFLVDKGVVIPINPKKAKRNLNLENNTSSILVTGDEHKNGRTFFWKNLTLFTNDSNDLKTATIMDISYMLETLHSSNKEEYIKSAKILIKRNFELCLYQ